MKKLFQLLLVPLLVLAVDSASKFWAELMLTPYQPMPLAGNFFRLTLGYNTGVAFGMLANGGPWPLIITGTIIAFLFIWFGQALLSGKLSTWAIWPVGLLLGGAVGNFVDRFPDGRVTDFLDVGYATTRWPTFNLADSFILIGVGLLTLLSFNYNQDDDDNEITPQFDHSFSEGEVDSFLPDVVNKP